MALKKKNTIKQLVREYHVYDNRMTDVAGVPVSGPDSNGVRIVKLTAQQAQYLIDQGAIGLTPQRDLSDDAFEVLSQMKGDPIKAD